MKLTAGFKAKCENISLQWRRELGLKSFEALSANLLAKHSYFDALIFTPNSLKTAPPEQVEHLMNNDNWSAGIACLSPLWIIYNPRHSPARYESSIMHELGHVILKHPMIRFDEKTGLPLREEQYEHEATFLGSCLQIPRRGLAWAIQKKMSIDDIAAYYGASVEMVKFRANLTVLKVTAIS